VREKKDFLESEIIAWNVKLAKITNGIIRTNTSKNGETKQSKAKEENKCHNTHRPLKQSPSF